MMDFMIHFLSGPLCCVRGVVYDATAETTIETKTQRVTSTVCVGNSTVNFPCRVHISLDTQLHDSPAELLLCCTNRRLGNVRPAAHNVGWLCTK